MQHSQQIREIGRIRSLIGDRAFYIRTLKLMLPMILQAAVTNFVSLLDNLMVGQIGTAQMSGVSIVNQYVFIYSLTLFGAVSGPGIFGAQFFGKGDSEGQKYTFRFRLLSCGLIILAGVLLFHFLSDPMISIFLSKSDSPELVASTLNYGKQYMAVVLFALIPFGIGQAYASVERESGLTHIPMIASIAALAINLFLDYGLIFGKFGLPEMGVIGAALATVIAKTAEALVMIVWAHTHPKKNRYLIGLFRGFYIPKDLIKVMIRKGLPLLLNEFTWSLGMSIVAQCYSVRGLDVVAARNIASTLNNMFNVVFIQMGAGIGIMVGQILGSGDLLRARLTNRKLYFFTMLVSSAIGAVTIPLATVFPALYQTEDSVRALAAFMIIVQAIATPMWTFTNACYFTLRSGGRIGVTIVFDAVYTWVIMIPLALILAYLTPMDIHPLFIIVTFSEMIKVVVGFFMVRSDSWLKTIVK